MQTITFYSYKGGVGRTLALANTARHLVGAGKRVFALDLDLEAPGLHYKLIADEEERRRAIRRGFAEYAHTYLLEEPLPLLKEHVHELNDGKLVLMPAGNVLKASYWKTLVKMNWAEQFFSAHGAGVPFFVNLLREIGEQYRPDFLLLDARTGITELGGVALTVLADQAVCLFANNPESIEGVLEIARALGRSADTRLPGAGPIRIVPVLTRYPRPSTLEEQARQQDERSDIQRRLEAALADTAPSEGAPELHTDLTVLPASRALEASEQVLLATDEAPDDTWLFAGYLELLEALGVETREEISLDALRERVVDATLREVRAARQEGRVQQAELSARRARAVAERLVDEDSREAGIAHATLELALVLRSEEMLRSVAARPTDDRYRRDAAWELVFFLANERRFTEATVTLDEAVRTLDADDPVGENQRLTTVWRQFDRDARDHPGYRLATIELLRSERRMQYPDLRKCEEVVSRAEPEFTSQIDEALRDLAALRHEQARMQVHAGALLAAERSYRDALELSGQFYEPTSDQMNLLRSELSETLHRQGRRTEARAVLQHREPLVAPRRQDLPQKRRCSARSRAATQTLVVDLEIVTPILGGAAVVRQLDDVDGIRVPTVRGHLRFWWRALHGSRGSAGELYARERRLFGGAADESGGRSAVEVSVRVDRLGRKDDRDVQAWGRHETPGSYALWPARATTGRLRQPTAPRRAPGTCFSLTLRFPRTDAGEIRATLRAWVLFGGYGARTRRGLGTLTVASASDGERWLPADPSTTALHATFGRDVLAPPAHREPDDLPLLAGAGLAVGTPSQRAEPSWTEALDWLKEFRQGAPSQGPPGRYDRDYARVRGDDRRPGRSNWPEADKLRRLSPGAPFAHEPHSQHGPDPIWPRAGFGLPIVGRFQRNDRSGQRYRKPEPEPFELRWQTRNPAQKEDFHDRLASPLIVKALPLADGRFAPCALWLNRGYPADGQVALKPNDPRWRGSEAAFDELVAAGDAPRFAPLDVEAPAGRRLRAAFFSWLRRRRGVNVVVP